VAKGGARVKKVLLVGAVIVVSLVAIVVGVTWWLNLSYQREIDRRLAEIRARGEPVMLEDLKSEPVPYEENAGVVYGRAANVLVLPHGGRMEPFLVPVRERTPEQEAIARQWVAHSEQALALIRQAGAKDRCQLRNQNTGYALDPSGLEALRYLPLLVLESARVHLADGDVQAAFGDGLTELRVAKHLSTGALLIEARLDVAVVALANEVLEQVFARPEIRRLDLAPLARAIEQLGQNFDFRAFVIGERAAAMDLFKHPWEIGAKRKSLQDALRGEGYLRLWGKREKLGILQGFDMFLMATEKPWYESYAERGELDAWLEKSAKYRPFPRVLVVVLLGGQKDMVALPALREAHLKELALSVELELHRRSTGSFPEALADVSLTYLKELPVDPFSGRAFVYRRQGEGYVLYSVGENGKDDGGKMEKSLKDLEGADDIVWTVEPGGGGEAR
jgi:hypothetical protein